MNILITGNLGYIGPVVVRRLRAVFPSASITGVDTGFFANCLTDQFVCPEAFLTRQYYVDLRRITPDLLRGVDVVVHLAAISNDPMGNAHEQVTNDINHVASVALAQKAKSAGVTAFVFASSCSVYGLADDSARSESSVVNPLTAYARSKVATERHLQELADGGFHVTCLRFATACGWSPRLRLDLVLNDFLACALANRRIEILSDGTPWRPLINVSDMARAIEWAITRPESAGGSYLIVNAGANEWNYQVRDLALAVQQQMPDVAVSINKNAQPDKRSYRVDFSLFQRLAPNHQPEENLTSTILNLRAGLEAIRFADPNFRNSHLIRLRALDMLKTQGYLDENLYWRTPSLASQRTPTPATVPCDAAGLKAEILKQTREYSRLAHAANRPGYETEGPSGVHRPAFIAGETTVPYAGRVFTESEVEAAVSAALDFWLTLGKEGDAFERSLAEFLGVKGSILCNSGSSANLLAISALSSPRLGERRLLPGDEIITAAAGFPTTVAPIVQNGFVPVFIDCDPITLNVRIDQLEDAYVEGKTKAVFLAHTLGNPFDLATITEFCRRHHLWLVEDNCDSLGCAYDGKLTGAFGDLSTQSFYPPHHLTLGEGGAVNIVGDPVFKAIVESFRDWGRDCWCASGKDNTCGKRFDCQLGDLPRGYDHKFTYSHFGYNLKPLDIQGAIGRAQLRKLPRFIQARIDNWTYLRANLHDCGEFFDFMLPTHATGWSPQGFSWDSSGHRSLCSWFGFMIRVKPGAPFTKFDFARYLDRKKIGNRMLFGGNLIRQPVFVQLRKDRPTAFRVISDLSGADAIMNNALFIGTYPGLTPDMLSYMVDTIQQFVRDY